MPSSYVKLLRRQASPLALLFASCSSVVAPPSDAGFDEQLVFLPAALRAADRASRYTVATGHCLVQTVHSAGFVQPGSQPIGRSSSGTGQTFGQLEHDGPDVVVFIFAGSHQTYVRRSA